MTKPRERYRCATRKAFPASACSCARFDDGSCVPHSMYPEFKRRRDEAWSSEKWKAGDWSNRSWADAQTYDWTECQTPMKPLDVNTGVKLVMPNMGLQLEHAACGVKHADRAIFWRYAIPKAVLLALWAMAMLTLIKT